jgi:hypothetical protein
MICRTFQVDLFIFNSPINAAEDLQAEHSQGYCYRELVYDNSRNPLPGDFFDKNHRLFLGYPDAYWAHGTPGKEMARELSADWALSFREDCGKAHNFPVRAGGY